GIPDLVDSRGHAGLGRRRRGDSRGRCRGRPAAGFAQGCRGTLSSMSEEKIRLGGMALANGVLVHGPTSWACAIRRADGRLEVASARKRFVASGVKIPLLRGPARLVEALAVLPE